MNLEESTQHRQHPGDGIRVLVLTRMWPTPERPHDGTFVKDEVEALQRLGVDCHVVAEPGPGGVGRYMQLWRKMRVALRKGHFDLVHAHHGTTGWVGRFQHDVPLVVTFHGSDLLGGRLTSKKHESVMGYVEMLLGRMLVRATTNIVIVSPKMLARTPVGRARVIPSGIDVMRFGPSDQREARQALGINGDHPIVLFPANPALVNKRYTLAREAVELAKQSIPELELLVVAGRPHTELPLWMNAANIMILTSIVEASSMVIKEALACNLSVVSVDAGDAAERLAGISGCRLVERDPAVIARGIVEVINGSEICNGREFIADLSVDASTRQLINMYWTAIRRSRRPIAN